MSWLTIRIKNFTIYNMMDLIWSFDLELNETFFKFATQKLKFLIIIR